MLLLADKYSTLSMLGGGDFSGPLPMAGIHACQHKLVSIYQAKHLIAV